MELSVVILNYNVKYFLNQCIISVKRATRNIDSEIIIIDNASVDGSCEMVQSLFPEVKLIQNKENVGFSKANNQAVRYAKGKYICILNPDTAVSEDTFTKCLNFAASKKELGAIGVKLIDGTGNFLPESKRNMPTPKASLLKLLGIGTKYYANHITENSKGEKVAVLVGAFMFLKRDLYNRVGGFDEEYFMYGEDIDLSYKILDIGRENYYLGTTEVLHYKGESTQKDKVYFNRFYGAMLIFYKKHFSRNKLSILGVKILVGLAKLLKSRTKQEDRPKSKDPKSIVVLTENFNLLKSLSEKIQNPVTSGSKAMFQDTLLTNTMFIFDLNYMPYSQIFAVMQQLKNRNNQFRIYPTEANYILGSDKSDEKGTVTVF